MELVDIVASDLLFLTVCGNPVPHGILHDQHSDLFELIAKLLNIKADDTIAHINVGAMIKEVLADVYELSVGFVVIRRYISVSVGNLSVNGSKTLS